MKHNIINGLLPFLLALLPIVAIFANEIAIPYVIFGMAVIVYVEKGKAQNYYRNRAILFPFLIAFGSYLVFTLLSPDIPLALKVLERQISLLLIPILIVLGFWDKERVALFFKIFILMVFAMGVFSIFKFGWFLSSNSEWINHMAHEKGSKLLYLQYKYPHILGSHPTYWSYLLVSGLILLWSNKNLRIFKSRTWLSGLIIFFNINLVVLASRTLLFVNVLVHLAFLFNYIRVKKIGPFRKIGIFTMGCLFIWVLLKTPLLSGKINFIQNDERMYYWPKAIEKIQDNFFILGEGLGQGNEVIKKEILIKGDNRLRYSGYDLHNQYLRHYLDMGIIGFTSLLLLLVFPLFGIRRTTSFDWLLQFSFLLLFASALITEAFLYRLKGIIFFSILSSFLCLCALGFNEREKREKTIPKPSF